MTPPCTANKAKQNKQGNDAWVPPAFALTLQDTEGSWTRARLTGVVRVKGFPWKMAQLRFLDLLGWQLCKEMMEVYIFP